MRPRISGTSLASARPVCYLRCVPPLTRPPAAKVRVRLRRSLVTGRAVALALAASVLLVTGAAAAHGEGGLPIDAALTPPAPPGDGATAARLIKEVEASSAAAPRTAKIVAEPLRHAKKALERAHGARMSNDVAHARMLDGLALEWAETARDLVRAAKAEESALTAAKKARELEVQVERARALLEETQARHGRAAADLARIEAEAAEAAKKAKDTEESRLETAGKKAGPKKAPDSSKKPAPAPSGKKGAQGAGAGAPKKGAR
jgi:hypothetical protein